MTVIQLPIWRDALSRAKAQVLDYIAAMTAASLPPMTKARNPDPSKGRRAVSAWLFGMCVLVAFMVIVGGATRLTDSGLSITEWRPISGALPPLSASAWEAEFEKYKAIPEYAIVNAGMSLDAFKTIYWWEWGHRFLGRLIGVAFLAPLIVFALKGFVSRRLGLALAGLFALGGLQGALGWYMVQSGLTERIDVSQYRLAAHLGLAVILFGALFWTALAVRAPVAAGVASARRWAPTGRLGWAGLAIAGLVYVQIVLGAFVAGLRAGRTYTDWPLMDGRWVPQGYFADAPGLRAIFDSVAAVQFNHRIGAYLLLVAAGMFWAAARGTALAPRARLVGAAVIAQAGLGVATLMAASPIALGLLHQAGALGVFAAAIYAVYGSTVAGGIPPTTSMSMTTASSSG